MASHGRHHRTRAAAMAARHGHGPVQAPEASQPRPREYAQHDTGTGPACPENPEHGRLLHWSSSQLYDLYCPHSGHTGFPFYKRADLAARR